MDKLNFETLKVESDRTTFKVQIYRPEHNNAINKQMIDEWSMLLSLLSQELCSVLIIEGLPDVFCYGADFSSIAKDSLAGHETNADPEKLMQIWSTLSAASYVVISHVKGRVNAGGMGFLGASDIVIADETATFSLSELLFGLIPACVLPFLIRRLGYQRAHYLTLMTQPIDAKKASEWGIIDVCEKKSDMALRKHLLPLKRLKKKSIGRYKAYMSQLYPIDRVTTNLAVATNHLVFSDIDNIEGITRYVERGIFPWE